MARPKEYKTRVPKTLNFEMNVYEEFQELCYKERVSVSNKLQGFMSEQIQKNAVGSASPINIIYSIPENKPLQSDLTQWIPTVHEHKDNPVMLVQIENISKACANTARSYLNQRRYRK